MPIRIEGLDGNSLDASDDFLMHRKRLADHVRLEVPWHKSLYIRRWPSIGHAD